MLRTYRAVLRGDRIEWIDAAPTSARPIPVHITRLEDETVGAASRGPEMAAALEALARSGGLGHHLHDPLAQAAEPEDAPDEGTSSTDA